MRQIAAVTLLIVMAAAEVAAAPLQRVAYVMDGDTFRLESGERIRIAGIDAPERMQGQARCSAEIALGNEAKRRTRALLKTKPLRSSASAGVKTARLPV